MSVTIPGRRQRLRHADDTYAITLERARCLAELINRPTTHTQRFIEQLSFERHGGQRWSRTLQIQIPENKTLSQATWWIVPLGPFKRCRFPDISVTDASGNRLNFVTRKQHGVALTKVALTKHIQELPILNIDSQLEREPCRTQYSSLRASLYDFYTEIGDDDERVAEAQALFKLYEQLLSNLAIDEDDRADPLKEFSSDLAAATKTTQYLCWVYAKPGEAINLCVSHTIKDAKHKLETGTLPGLWQALKIGILGSLSKKTNLTERREVWNRWYMQVGLAPIPYSFSIPTSDYTVSYYSTVEPPLNTEVAYLDWEQGNSWDKRSEVDSSLDCLHIFGTDESALLGQGHPQGTGAQQITTRAYLRCTPRQHKQILGVALMSIVLVVLVAVGRFPSEIGDPLQTLLTATPSILVAFLAQQQRHYYSHALRRSRAILWGYLFIEVLFVIAVAFSERVDKEGTPGLGWKATIAAWLLAMSSVFVFVWQFPLGYSYERVIKYFTERKKEMMHKPGIDVLTKRQKMRRWLSALRWEDTVKDSWQCYELAVEQYSRLIRRAMFLSVVATLIVLAFLWHPAAPENHAPGREHFSPKGENILISALVKNKQLYK